MSHVFCDAGSRKPRRVYFDSLYVDSLHVLARKTACTDHPSDTKDDTKDECNYIKLFPYTNAQPSMQSTIHELLGCIDSLDSKIGDIDRRLSYLEERIQTISDNCQECKNFFAINKSDHTMTLVTPDDERYTFVVNSGFQQGKSSSSTSQGES